VRVFLNIRKKKMTDFIRQMSKQDPQQPNPEPMQGENQEEQPRRR